MSVKPHWERIYTEKPVEQVSWYRQHLDISLDLIRESGLPKDAAIIDIGGGASTLVDDLLDRGYTNVSVLDIAKTALEVAQTRLGA